MSAPKVLQVGVVLFNGALPLDFIGPSSILSALSPSSIERNSIETPYAFEITNLGETLDDVTCTGNLNIRPGKTYADVREGRAKMDIMLLPGGVGARPWNASQALKAFIKWGAGSAEYTLTVCTGSWLLADTGALNGQRATTNKAAFLECKKATAEHTVEWIPEARFVHSGKFWTSSGVSAGIDMACGFVDELCGKEAGEKARDWAEYTSASEGDDPFAKKCGLI
ncbi:class I glutamine amidotransferase-like protein [Dioszegia hungarica]|uniref:Class I glutamine amidotransferase-like protein n=1 Tax=Dioszegia hungarica TaxID=4972 RepID=A0AA38H3H5_9TREE|nr:class I glutamine amidotransferase-like protein [Dioszegia hungarica]KAI9633370.1 class I glutamine amidotransferase-like protein [Dioszegia hungarica]